MCFIIFFACKQYEDKDSCLFCQQMTGLQVFLEKEVAVLGLKWIFQELQCPS